MHEPHLILGIGELLWDMLPEGPRLGGAPANFAVMAGRLGNRAAILSRLGRDELGRQAIDRLDPMPVETSYLEIDPAHETGRVTVSFSSGEPHYIIHDPAAWDYMDLSDDWIQLAERADAICFGSLAQRNQHSRQTIQTLAAATSASCIRIFDVNLRAPFYSSEILEESLELSTVVKMNDTEVPLVLELLAIDLEEAGAPDRPRPANELLRPAAERLLRAFPALQLVAITRGSRGSLLATRDEWDEHPGFPVKVADAVGSGDAFTAALTHYLLRGAGLALLNEAGNRWGGWTASQSGAMPALPDTVRDAITAAIEKTAN
ncbi:putative fructokinase [Candidatus Sulfotelmatomonas gaucii]|uniref:Putative fructokinase n=1 Tax=Candidatus Sulfuritelmatomonas gaucii TaxID=2043161 RepID=A0A2N9L536_9BACT|nr:putative fructokinase [Candidatus Sulfotelmatomonas gaucii]